MPHSKIRFGSRLTISGVCFGAFLRINVCA